VTRVLLIAASPRERHRLEDLLEDAGAQVVGSIANLDALTDEILEAAELLLILLDSSNDAPHEELLETLQEQGILRETPVVFLTGPHSQQWTNRALHAGIHGILPVDLTASQLTASLQTVAQGLIVLHPVEAQIRNDNAALGETGIAELLEPLTAREREVLQMLAQGRGNKQIAVRLNISEHTVKFHVASILGKLGASTRTEAVSLALRRGLILL
jgi:two-component system, NarL family, response regulator YdfI